MIPDEPSDLRQERITALLTNDLLAEAIERQRSRIYSAWATTRGAESDTRERHWYALQAVNGLIREIEVMLTETSPKPEADKEVFV